MVNIFIGMTWKAAERKCPLFGTWRVVEMMGYLTRHYGIVGTELKLPWVQE